MQQNTRASKQAPEPKTAADSPETWGILYPFGPLLRGSTSIPLERAGVLVDKSKLPHGTKEVRKLTIGRNGESDVVINESFISGLHCVLELVVETSGVHKIMVQNHGRNGTTINNDFIAPCESVRLNLGDVLSFGQEVGCSYALVPHIQSSLIVGDGKYVLRLSPLGRGAFGEVYLAQHYSTGQLLACKCINKKSATSNKIRAEIEIMKDIQHPLVCQYVEAFENEKTIQILLELAAGGNLLQYIINKGAGGIREVETKPIAAQASIAMEYLHAKGITHRDLKPDNILLTRTTPPLVKIADFGFAKVIDKNSMLQTQCGTAIYIAPEVFIRTGRTGYDHKVDCWSLGLVVTAMLLGKHPFSSQRDLHEMHNYEMKHWETLTKRFSSKCVHWLQHMVTVDPADRMDMTQAVNHAWLASSAESLGYGRREPRESQTTSTNSTSTVGDGNPSAHPSSQVLQQFNESMSSMTIGNPSQASTSELGTPFLSSSVTTTTNAEDASWPDLIGGLSASTSTSLGIPGAFPHAAAAHTGGTSCPDLVGELTAGTSTLLPIPGAFPRSLEGQPEDSPANHPRREEASSSTMGAGAHRNDRRSLRLRRGKGGVLGRLPRGG